MTKMLLSKAFGFFGSHPVVLRADSWLTLCSEATSNGNWHTVCSARIEYQSAACKASAR